MRYLVESCECQLMLEASGGVAQRVKLFAKQIGDVLGIERGGRHRRVGGGDARQHRVVDRNGRWRADGAFEGDFGIGGL